MRKAVPVFAYNSVFTHVLNFFSIAVVWMAALVFSFDICGKTLNPGCFYLYIVIFFFLDIIIQFVTSIRKDMDLIDDRRRIAIHYLRGWFTVDILAVLPFAVWLALTAPFAGQNKPPLPWIILFLMPLIKLSKVPLWFNNLQKHLSLNPSVMRFIVFAFWFTLAVHAMSLGWLLIGAGETVRSYLDQYIRALYWCTTTIATIGYGDYTPDHDSNLQILYTIGVQIIGVGMYGYIIGNMASLIANLDVAKNVFMKKMEEINDYFHVKRIPPELQNRVRDYYYYLWETRKSVSAFTVIEGLPPALAMDLLLFVNKGILEKVELFRNTDEVFIREIVQLLRPMVFLPEDYIIRQGEYGECMYFLNSGDAEVLINNKRIALLGSGSPFGETALLQSERRTASIRALTYCDTYTLYKNDFNDLRRKYPEFDTQVRRVMEERARQNRDGRRE